MKRNGFTLVELIIVIAVIGILTAILIPVFTNVVNKANEKSALSDARNIVEEYIIEDQIRDNEHRARLPENVLILVYKGGRFYAYGYNTAIGGAIQVSAANPMKADDFQDCIDKYSWNNSDAHRGTAYDPTVDQAVLDSYTIEHDGAFYVVPYDGLTPAAPNVRGISVRTAEYPASYDDEVYRLINNDETNEMDFDYGEQTCIFHGCLVGAGWHEETVPEPETKYNVTLRKGEISESVSFVDNSEFTDGMTVQGGSNFTIKGLKAATKTFDGWYYSSTDKAGQKLTGLVNITEDTEFTAHWVDKTCTIELVENGGSYTSVPSQFGGGLTWSNAPISTNIHTIISVLSWTAPENNTQQGWQIKLGDAAYVTYSSDNTYAFTDGMTVKIKPVYNLNTYTISFNTDGGTPATIADITVTHGGTLTFPTPQPTKTNFNFLGWKRTDILTDPTSYNGAAYPNEVTSNMAFTAQWGSYSVTFYQSNGDPITTTHNGNVYAVPQVGSGEGYVNVPSGFEFDGWTVAPSGAPACDKNATSYTADRNGITITAKMKAIQWNVTFWNSYDDTEYTSLAMTVDDGDSLDTLPAAPAAPATGYTFARWSGQKNGTTPFSDSDAIEADTQIWAVWNDNSSKTVTVTVSDTWNGYSVSVGTVTVGGTDTTVSATDSTLAASIRTSMPYFMPDNATYTISGTAVTITGTRLAQKSGSSYVEYTYGVKPYDSSDTNCYQMITANPGFTNINTDSTTIVRRYMLNNDLSGLNNINPVGTLPAGLSAFGGIFDGCGHTISASLASKSNTTYYGLFAGIASAGIVKNLTLTSGYSDGHFGGSSVSDASNYMIIGALAGSNAGTIENVTVDDVIVRGKYTVGGFVGLNIGTIENCAYIGNVTAVSSSTSEGKIGGFVGENQGSISHCSVSGSSVVCKNATRFVGGFAGAVTSGGSVLDCSVGLRWVENESFNADYIGGFVGSVEGSSTISWCSCNVNYNGGGYVCGKQMVGGFAGVIQGSASVTYSYAEVDTVSGKSNDTGFQYAGGFASIVSSATVSNCYAICDLVTQDQYTSGFATAYNYANIQRCYASLASLDSMYDDGYYHYAKAYGVCSVPSLTGQTISGVYYTGTTTSDELASYISNNASALWSAVSSSWGTYWEYTDGYVHLKAYAG